ncbi:MAG TPA: hypothetical protein VK203_27780 [Nostocaceae cyanobacterium]|nr:hypothetical protein [Nostocaceae cyanobacterium]
MGYITEKESPETVAVKEIYLAAINDSLIFQEGGQIRRRYESNHCTELTLASDFQHLAENAIAQYALNYADEIWKEETLQLTDLVNQLAEKLKHYFLRVNTIPHS